MHDLMQLKGSHLGLAVSGGSDSVAMLHLAIDWAQKNSVTPHVITINHQLRTEAKAEAEWVKNHCTALGVACDSRLWSDHPARGNLQQNARKARRRLIADWAKSLGIKQVLLGHTMDDQAETFLLRLARGSGVHGLSAMATKSHANGLEWLRPLLGIRRAALRDYLCENNLSWLNDASNHNTRFDRIKMRQAQPILDNLGLRKCDY